MAQVKFHKVVSALPGTLEADSVYLVRVGTGFDLYATNSSGMIVAYALNSVGSTVQLGVKTATIDFGSTPVMSKTFVIADLYAVIGRRVSMTASNEPMAGVSADEFEMDALICAAHVSAAGQITCSVMAYPGPITGQRKVSYVIGAAENVESGFMTYPQVP